MNSCLPVQRFITRHTHTNVYKNAPIQTEHGANWPCCYSSKIHTNNYCSIRLKHIHVIHVHIVPLKMLSVSTATKTWSTDIQGRKLFVSAGICRVSGSHITKPGKMVASDWAFLRETKYHFLSLSLPLSGFLFVNAFSCILIVVWLMVSCPNPNICLLKPSSLSMVQKTFANGCFQKRN